MYLVRHELFHPEEANQELTDRAPGREDLNPARKFADVAFAERTTIATKRLLAARKLCTRTSQFNNKVQFAVILTFWWKK